MQSVDTRPSGESGHGRLNSAVRGAFAGFAATLPMTAVMFAVQLVLPRSSQIRPEPRVITDKLLQRANIYQKTSERGRKLAALANHFAYGAASGAVCATIAGARLQSSPSTGLLSGLLIWMGSYAGWLPAAKILPPPRDRLPGRNVLLLAAHSVWGLSLHSVLRRSRKYNRW
jgi:hypothetical protein